MMPKDQARVFRRNHDHKAKSVQHDCKMHQLSKQNHHNALKLCRNPETEEEREEKRKREKCFFYLHKGYKMCLYTVEKKVLDTTNQTNQFS